jgi:trk system potassium uptake protein TrkH
VLSDIEIRLGLSISIGATIIFTLKQFSFSDFYAEISGSFGKLIEIIWGNFFTVFSFITTNGYVSTFWNSSLSSLDLSYTVIILMGLCLFGGGVATTAGGVKLLRISILFSAFSNETGKLLHPSSVVVNKNNPMKDLEISVFMAWIFFMLFMVSTATLTVILTVFELRFEDALLLAVACLTTTGPILEMVELDDFLIIDLSIFSKIALIIGMVLGRLEILVALSLITFGLNRV